MNAGSVGKWGANVTTDGMGALTPRLLLTAFAVVAGGAVSSLHRHGSSRYGLRALPSCHGCGVLSSSWRGK